MTKYMSEEYQKEGKKTNKVVSALILFSLVFFGAAFSSSEWWLQ